MDAAMLSSAEQLPPAGVRVTAQRLAVLAALAGVTDHPDADAVAASVRAQLGAVSMQAIYDVLNSLTLAGLVRRIEPAGGPARFEARVGDNHHHVVCRSCSAATDVDCVLGTAPCLDPNVSHGFLIDEAEVTFWGLCPDCQARRAGGATDLEQSADQRPLQREGARH